MLRLVPSLLVSVLVLSCGGSSQPAAQAPAVAQPAAPAAVGTVQLTVTAAPGRELPAIVWYPAEQPGAGAPPVLGRTLPVVVISHGLGGKKEHASFLAERVAAAGYLVAAVDHVGDGVEIALQRPVDVTKLLDRLGERGGEPAWLADLADLDKVAVYGHSFGGYTALALAGAKVGPNPEWTALCNAAPTTPGCPPPTPEQMKPVSLRDPRVDAVVAATPGGYIQFGRAGTAAIETPIVLLAAGKDRLIATPQYVRPLFDHARHPRWLFEIELANHFTFVDLCAQLAQIPPPFHDEVAEACAPDAPIALATAHALIGDVVVGSLDHLLKGAPAPDLDALAKARGIAVRADAAR
ncbi:MAG TPA: alpha/beta hydrolase [Kofleriaceae bacterium]|nr:alpha/beta hydrolase [Kofleriaceae bacterium]